jgi:hypothetical protein
MKTFARLVSALGLAAVFVATAAFAQAPAGRHVKGYTKTLKSGKTVNVKGYDRAAKMPMPKMAHVKGYTKTLKSGKSVNVKGYNRVKNTPMMKRPMMKAPMTPGINPGAKM